MHDITPPKNVKKPKILIVDDDPLCIDIYSTKLRSSGYDVTCVDDGEAAIKVATADHPDAILLDNLMPNLSGQQVLERLKSDAATRDIPVIMLSVVNREDEIKSAIEHGAVCYLVKSDFTPQQIIDELQRCMK